MKNVKQAIKILLNANFKISVFDGEIWAVKQSSDLSAIWGAVDSVDESALRIRRADLEKPLFVGIVDNEINDHSDHKILNVLIDQLFI